MKYFVKEVGPSLYCESKTLVSDITRPSRHSIALNCVEHPSDESENLNTIARLDIDIEIFLEHGENKSDIK